MNASTMSATEAAAILAKSLANKDNLAERSELAWYAGLNDDTRSLVNVLVASLTRQIPGVGPNTGLEIVHAIHRRYIDEQAPRVSRARARVVCTSVNTHPHTKNAAGK